jgi:ABC-2 type transport system permease protein
MLWYKAWLETRWRFVVGMLLLMCFGALVVLSHPMLEQMKVEIPNLPGNLSEQLREAFALMTTYEGYVWSQWFGKNLPQFWTLFAVLLGAGGLATEASRGTALWTLSLPVTRRRLLGVRAGVGAVELLALAVVPTLLVWALSPLVGQRYKIADALAYALMTFAGGMFFYGLALLLSTVFGDQLKPILIGMAVAIAMGMVTLFSRRLAEYSVYKVMSGQRYFAEGVPPWAGLLVCLALAASMFFVSLRVLERRDF